jgi:hypothetical protein
MINYDLLFEDRHEDYKVILQELLKAKPGG